MENRRQNGYSASVEAFLRLGDSITVRVAKTNCVTLTLAEPCELPPETECDLIIFVDGRRESRIIKIHDGVALGQRDVSYTVLAPF